MANVVQIPFDRVHQTWPLVEKYFAAVEPFTKGDYSLEQMRGKLFQNHWGLIVFVEDNQIIGALGVFYENRLNHRVAFIPALGGENITNPDNWEQLKKLFAHNGATYVEAAMRPATFRLWDGLGFTEKYRVAGVALPT